MKCISNIDRINYPSDLVMELTKLYRFKGKDFYYEDALKTRLSSIIKLTIEKDTFFAAKLLNLNITENRVRLIIRKDAKPKTKDEQILANLKEVFTLIQEKGTDIELTTNEFLHLAKKIFNDVKEIGFDYYIKKERFYLIEEKKRISKRDDFEVILNKYRKLLDSDTIEPTQLITNLYVDLLHMNIYSSENEFLCLLIYYCLLFRERFNVFKYYSFFQLHYEHLEEFNLATVSASYNWEDGFAQTAVLNRLTIKMLLEGYANIENKVGDVMIDRKIRKIDNVEISILKLGEVFTRDQIKQAQPDISDSTLNRALENLKKQNKIRPNGTGRSATWVRLVDEDRILPNIKQMSLYDLMMEHEE